MCGVDRLVFFFVKHKTAYEMRISDWSSDVCSSDLRRVPVQVSSGEGGENDAQDLPLALARRRARAARRGGHSLGPRREDRTSVVKGKSVSVRVDLGGRRIIKKQR